MPPALTHVDTWIFDLDNTLYPASCDLFALIDARMNLYLRNLFNVDAAEAHRIQKRYFHDHGTTLSGLMTLIIIDDPDRVLVLFRLHLIQNLMRCQKR